MRKMLVVLAVPVAVGVAVGAGPWGETVGAPEELASLEAGAEVEPRLPRGSSATPDTLARVAWHQVDRGRGILHFAEPPVWDPQAPDAEQPDTIGLWSDPGGEQLVGWLVRQRDGAVHLVQAAGVAVLANLLEYAYEDVGMPVDSVLATGGGSWARVLYGVDAAGRSVPAWTPIDERLRHRSWRGFLPEQALFSLGALELRDAPGGSTVVFAPIDDSYVIEPDSVAGDWLRARIVSPHPCRGEPVARDTVAWLRFLDDETGRPRVWYHTRGC